MFQKLQRLEEAFRAAQNPGYVSQINQINRINTEEQFVEFLAQKFVELKEDDKGLLTLSIMEDVSGNFGMVGCGGLSILYKGNGGNGNAILGPEGAELGPHLFLAGSWIEKC